MSAISDALASVRQRIDRAAALASRDPRTVRLVAVSKTKPASAIRDAYAAGQRDFGENYAQELAAKAAELSDLPDLRWHFIGHLQSNKAKLVVPVAHAVHTVDSPSLARELAKRRAADAREPLRVLVEVNVGGEAQKHGAHPNDVGPLLAAIEALPSLALVGLMTVPPQGEGASRSAFDSLCVLRAEHGGAERLPELSIGMSDDLEVAVERGATLVRIGTAIFGGRS